MTTTLEHKVLQSMVTDILKNRHRYDWTLQGLGMLRLKLPNGMRLHVWDDRFRWVADARIHDHPWDFTSLIVSGMIWNTRYHPTPRADWKDIGTASIARNQLRIKCGEGSCDHGEPVPVVLIPLDTETYGPGMRYNQRRDEIHLSEALNGTVSIIERIGDTEIANVYYEKTWDSAEPRRPCAIQLETICTGALSMLDLMAKGLLT